MKTFTCLTLSGLLLLCVLSCKKAGPAPNSASNKPSPSVDTSATGTKHDTLITDVYITGYYISKYLKTYAQLWKNGVGTPLSYVDGSTGMHVVVLNGNTYVCGKEGRFAAYWKNFEMATPLTDGNEASSIANDIILQGSDLLCVGTIKYKTGPSKAILWRNWQRNVIDSSNAAATRILIKGNDIYITGSRIDANGKPVACYWKNGIAHDLSAPIVASASGIAIDNNSNVYVCGTLHPDSQGTPVYWKNDVMTMLPKTRKWAWANAITIKGDDVYIVGSGEDDSYLGYNEAYYWKNGIQQYFPGGSGINDIAFINNNPFIAGSKYSALYPYGRFWENTSIPYVEPTLFIAYLETNTISDFNGFYIDQYKSQVTKN